MSTDYYLICKSKKIYMPIFTMNIGGLWIADKRWLFDFIMKIDSEAEFLHEAALHDFAEELAEAQGRDDDSTLEDFGYEFMNAWHPYVETEQT